MKEFILHVGTMKTGTTYLQNILSQNREFLAAQGWRYPGALLNQQHACYGLCGSDIHWVKDKGQAHRRYGTQLIDEIAQAREKDAQAHIIISAEALSAMAAPGIERFLGKVGAPTRIVFTVRPLWLLIPSAWQQTIKGGHAISLRRFVERRFLSPWEKDNAPMTLTYAYGRSAARWAQISGAPVDVVEHLSSDGGPSSLWDSFRTVCGLPAVPDTDVPVVSANKSLSKEATDLLVQVNELLRGNKDEERLRRLYLNEILFPLSDNSVGSRPVLPPEYAEEVNRMNAREIEWASRYATIHTTGDIGKRIFSPGAQAPPGSIPYVAAAHQIVRLLPYLKKRKPAKKAAAGQARSS